MMPDLKTLMEKPQPPKPQVSDGKITKMQKMKIQVFHEVSKSLGFRFSEDFEGMTPQEITNALLGAIAAKGGDQGETKVILMHAFDVTFADKPYTIGRLPWKAEAGIRKKMQALIVKASSFVGKEGISLEDITDQDAVGVFVPFLLNEAFDTVVDIFWDYVEQSTPGVTRTEQGAECFVDEMINAVVALLEVVIPFFAQQARRTMGAAKGINLVSAAA